MDKSTALDRYLSAILILSERYYCVRAVDVAHYLSCSKAAVSVSLKHLMREELVHPDEAGALTLTAAGADRARRYKEKCAYFTDLLLKAGVEPSQAAPEGEALCRAVGDDTYQALKAYFENPVAS